MSRWIVLVTKSQCGDVEVESDSFSEAQDLASKCDLDPSESRTVMAQPKEQLGEPWVRISNLFLSIQRPDDQRVIVFSRSYGHSFSQEEFALLKDRLVRIG